MKILIVNKFLYPNGGSETYIFEIGKQLQKMGHEVQYFGMEHERNIVGNHAKSYTSNMEFRGGGDKLSKLLYPFRIIYSVEARKKLRVILDDFQPDVVHLNNINFQLTPSILYEARKYENDTKRKIKIIATAHDYQWICPNHMLYIPKCEVTCERCTRGKYYNCTKYRCIHSSFIKSILGSVESYFYHMRKTYDLIDTIICPSEYMKKQLSKDKVLAPKLVVLHNFIAVNTHSSEAEFPQKGEYVLYFGRYDKEKGIQTLLDVCKELPDIPFVFAGSGSLEGKISFIPNVKNAGFKSGTELVDLIRKARFSIYPSEWYENCPFSVMESQMYGTPVIGADIGGIPELINDGVNGELFESGNASALKEKILRLWNNEKKQEEYCQACRNIQFDSIEVYCNKLLQMY